MNLAKRDLSIPRIPLERIREIDAAITAAEMHLARIAFAEAERLCQGDRTMMLPALELQRRALTGAVELVEMRMRSIRSKAG